MNLHALINNVTIPHTDRTIGSEKALHQVLTNKHDIIQIELTFGFPSVHIYNELKHNIERVLNQKIELHIENNIIAHQVQANLTTIKGVKNIIAIASGKGGVGKSTVTANLATAMARMGARVGVLDADLYGPSQPTMLGVNTHQPQQQQKKFIPVQNHDHIQIMSIGFLVDPDQAVVWRGPMVSQALQQLLFQSEWNNVDYLFIDLPPGTGDIQLTLSQKIPVTGALIVTTPQDIALIDAQKAIDMFNKVHIPLLGILENMSIHTCSQCGHSEAIFGSDGGQTLAEKFHIQLLGQLPLSLPIRAAMDNGNCAQLQSRYPQIAEIYENAAFSLALQIADKSKDYSHRFPKIIIE